MYYFIVYSAALLLRFNRRRANAAYCEVAWVSFLAREFLFVKLTAVRMGATQTLIVSPS